jgi:hypothetical protein
MSHIVKIAIEVKDLDALAAAARALGLELMRGQRTYRHYGAHEAQTGLPEGFTMKDLGQCEHALRIVGADKEACEIGIARRRDGRPGYVLLADMFSYGQLPEHVGANCEKLKQNYSSEVARRTLQKQGYRVTSATKADGRIVLQATR